MRIAQFVVAAVLLLTGGFAGGWFAKTKAGAGTATSQPVADADPWKGAPDWTEWRYPGSEEGGAAKGGHVIDSDLKVGPQYTVTLTTPDDYDKVLRFYADKFGAPIIAVPTGSGTLVRTDSNAPVDKAVQGAVVQAGMRPPGDRAAGEWRPVRAKIITRRTERYDLVIHVSRADAEKHTHVVIAYMPNP